MKKQPLPFPRVFDDPEAARGYAKRAAHRGRRVGRIAAAGLLRRGFAKGRILDAGCGAGDLALELGRSIPQAEIVGLDLSEPLLVLARQSAQASQLDDRVSFEKGDVQSMPFQDGWFDIVVSLNTLHVVEEPVLMLNEIERVLCPGGRLLLSDIKRAWPAVFLPILKSAYTPQEAMDLLKQSRLSEWRVEERLLWFGIEGSAAGAL